MPSLQPTPDFPTEAALASPASRLNAPLCPAASSLSRGVPDTRTGLICTFPQPMNLGKLEKNSLSTKWCR
jgi:hypothetical protein